MQPEQKERRSRRTTSTPTVPAAEKPADGTFDWSDIKEKWNQLRGRGQRKDLEEFAEAIAVLDSVVM